MGINGGANGRLVGVRMCIGSDKSCGCKEGLYGWNVWWLRIQRREDRLENCVMEGRWRWN